MTRGHDALVEAEAEAVPRDLGLIAAVVRTGGEDAGPDPVEDLRLLGLRAAAEIVRQMPRQAPGFGMIEAGRRMARGRPIAGQFAAQPAGLQPIARLDQIDHLQARQGSRRLQAASPVGQGFLIGKAALRFHGAVETMRRVSMALHLGGERLGEVRRIDGVRPKRLGMQDDRQGRTAAPAFDGRHGDGKRHEKSGNHRPKRRRGLRRAGNAGPLIPPDLNLWTSPMR